MAHTPESEKLAGQDTADKARLHERMESSAAVIEREGTTKLNALLTGQPQAAPCWLSASTAVACH
jgi:hypothetical protein